MQFTRLLFVITFTISLCRTFSAKNEVVIPNLRQSRNYGSYGRFRIDRRIVEEKLEELSRQGMEVELLSATEYNTGLYGEVSIFIQHFWDFTLPDQLDPELLDQVSTDSRFLFIGIPVISNGDHVLIMLGVFTDEKNPVIVPYMTNYKAARQIDSIEIGDDDLVTLRDGNDVMVFRVSHDKDCVNNKTVGHNFDDITGKKDIRLTNYPMQFDWGCDLIGGEINFCLVLDPFMNDIMNADGNVCTSMSTSRSVRCSAEMELLEMTGVFRETAPYMASLVPIKAFKTEWMEERDHSIGVVYPCL